MSSKKNKEPERLKRGKEFELDEKSGWDGTVNGKVSFEHYVKSVTGKRGRVDIFIDELGDFVTIVEIKATDWDKILPRRIDININRHARQVWKYTEPYLEAGREVCPGIIYPRSPVKSGLKERIEEKMNEMGIQIAWRYGPPK